MASNLSSGFARALGRIIRDVLGSLTRSSSQPARSTTTPRKSSPATSSSYPGDYTGTPTITYDPHPGKLADPGEVVWTWVPYEEDHSQGKDRPVLIIGRDGGWLLAVALTSKDHDRDAAQEAAAGRRWIDVGTGSWDPQGRPSEVRVNRIIRVNPDEVRRVTDKLPQDKFELVAAAIRRYA